MKLIVGLGNPHKEYELTKHNVGFLALDSIVENQKLLPFRLENQFGSEITEMNVVSDKRVIFAKPQLYMNKSGESVQKILSYYKIGLDDLVVISDDLDLELGVIRVRKEGSSGGHKGLESVIDNLGDNRFIRIKIGIGSNRNANIPSEDYVLSKFTKIELDILYKSIDKTRELVLNWLTNGIIKEETIKVKIT